MPIKLKIPEVRQSLMPVFKQLFKSGAIQSNIHGTDDFSLTTFTNEAVNKIGTIKDTVGESKLKLSSMVEAELPSKSNSLKVKARMVIFSHLSDITESGTKQQREHSEFVKYLLIHVKDLDANINPDAMYAEFKKKNSNFL